MPRIPDNRSSVRETRASSSGTATRWRGLHEVEHSLIADVAVGAEQQSLDTYLDPFRLPGPLRHVGGLAMLVVPPG